MARGHPVNRQRVLTELPTAGRQPACYKRERSLAAGRG